MCTYADKWKDEGRKYIKTEINITKEWKKARSRKIRKKGKK
jgi:hypothetical protein